MVAFLLVALSVGDSLTTAYILARGGQEGNPIMAQLMVVLGCHTALMFKVIVTAGIAVWLVGAWRYRLAKVAMLIAISMHSIVVGRHLFYIIGGYV
jgi:hypothetical protein